MGLRVLHVKFILNVATREEHTAFARSRQDDSTALVRILGLCLTSNQLDLSVGQDHLGESP